MSLNPEDLLERLQALTVEFPTSRWVVAFSGGIDSTVLLHALVSSRTAIPIIAVHIDHGMNADSAAWAAHCEAVAGSLGVIFESYNVTVPENSENGPEAAARQARYAALLKMLRDGDCLLSGHHENDQAETLLLNLMRGSGPAGLAGMGAKQSFGRGLLLRPLLGVPESDIRDYAESREVSWIDDPSNVDTRFDRNFLRREIMPKLASRWPAVSNRLRRSAELVGEASELLNDLADIDLEACGGRNCLDIDVLINLSQPRQRNLLRRAVRLCGLPPPPATRLYQAINELIPARTDAQPLVSWPGGEMRRYRDHLYIMPALADKTEPPSGRLRVDGAPLALGQGLGSLALSESEVGGIDRALVEKGLEVRFRSGGEEIRITAQGSTRKLKKLLQETGVVPWMRGRVPLLFAGSTLVAVGDLWVSSDYLSADGLAVTWRDKPPLL
jgi:tRNA(Ile)-lysidine synthase